MDEKEKDHVDRRKWMLDLQDKVFKEYGKPKRNSELDVKEDISTQALNPRRHSSVPSSEIITGRMVVRKITMYSNPVNSR